MKILRLDLLAYGPFTRRPLEFPADGPNLHIVYGPNEAGKTTTLRAITGFFYGIDVQTQDAHLHPTSDLRIGATLRHSSGEARSFVRKKGNRATLLDPKGNVLDEAALRAWLSVSERKHFEQMFGLSHEQLREAGAALADAKTDVGRMLFGASLDGTTLHQTLVRLDRESELLLTAGGNSGAITKALVAYREHQARVKGLTLLAKDWQSVQTDIDESVGKQESLSAEVVRLRTEHHRQERLQRALPWLRQREDALREMAAMGEVQLLPAGVDAQRRDLAHAMDAAETALLRVQAEAARTRRERDGLPRNEPLLAAGARIKQLTEDLGKFKAEQRDRPGVQREVIAYRNEQRELLRQIGFGDVDPRAVAAIRVDDAALARVRKLEQDGLKRQTRLDGLRAQAATQRALVSQHELALAGLPPVADPAVLRATWEHLRADKNLARTILDAKGQLASLDAKAASAHAALAPWSGARDDAPSLPVPAEEAIRSFEGLFTEDDRTRGDLASRVSTSTRELDELRSGLAALTAAGEPPSSERLAAARARRDLGWERVCRAWSVGVAPSAIDESFASDVPLVAAYAASVRVADELADELRRESTRAAEYAGLRREEAGKVAELDALTREGAAVDLRAGLRRESWRQAWAGCGFEPATPREMLGWRGRHAALLEALRRRAEAAEKLDALERTMREQREALLGALAVAGSPLSADTSWLALLLHAEHTLRSSDEAVASRTELQRDLRAARQEVASLDARIAECEAERAEWRAVWGDAVAKLRLSSDALPEEASVVSAKLTEVFRVEEKCERQEVRLKAIDKQMQHFEATLAALVQEFSPELVGTAVERADVLIALHAEAAKTAERRRTLDELLAQHERDLEGAALTRDAERRRLDALLHEFACDDLAALDAALARSTQGREIEARRVEAEKRLAEVGEGWTLESLERAARETDSDRVESEIAALDERLKGLDAEQRQRTEALGALRERQRKFSGADAAAGVLAEAQEHLAQARTHAERYARLRLATALLRRGIESYRQKNEGAILRRAGQLFECLTLGRYQQLRVETDGDKAKLTCMRGAQAVDVKNALSDGTLDQLYLSLRFASLEQHLEAQEPMPLVLDDIFIHFDDDRTMAGLRVLAEFAQKTQVLLLTHHARNLDLARRALDAGAWREHRLDPPAGIAAALEP